MVGALSIIRFRTAIKDPIDVAYLFWAVGMGIVSGAGLWMLALMSSVIIGIILFLSIRLQSFDRYSLNKSVKSGHSTDGNEVLLVAVWSS